MNDSVDRAAARTARIGAMTATALGALGMLFELANGRGLPGIPHWPALVSILVSATLFAVLAVLAERTSARLASTLFVVNAAAIAFALSMRDPHYARSDHWLPFQANKLGCIVAALLGPELWSAFVGIGVHLTGALVVLFILEPELRARVASEPAGALAFAGVGVVLALYRQRRLALEREVATARAETIAAERLARTVLAIRELANTPIQTIELCAEILRVRSAEADPQNFQRLRRAIERLRGVSELLLRHSDGVHWHVDDASIDAVGELERSSRIPAQRMYGPDIGPDDGGS